jgi:heme-degrading monooxygenase HmoA
MHARIARYAFSGDAQEIARTAEEGMLPIFQAQPGFKSYAVIESEDELISFSAWKTSEAAEAANAAAIEWVTKNLSDKVDLKESRFGEILFATALGVSTKAGATV